jgi:hypothetical protein
MIRGGGTAAGIDDLFRNLQPVSAAAPGIVCPRLLRLSESRAMSAVFAGPANLHTCCGSHEHERT